MERFQESSDLRIGKILEVSGTSLRVEIDPKISELTRAVEGRVYPIGQLASIVKIHYGRKILFAYVRLLRMRSEIAIEEGAQQIAPGDDSRILEADLFAQGVWLVDEMRLEFSRGVETYPLPLQSVYLTTNEELDALYTAAEGALSHGETSPMVTIGEYVGGSGAQCRANIDRLFGQHAAVLGSTGSGKSGTVAALIHAVLDHKGTDGKPLKPRIVVIDPHGEYSAAFKGRAVVFRAYSAAAAPVGATTELRLPYWLMSGDELRGLIIGKTEAEATSQNNIVYKALKYSRMVTAGIVTAAPHGSVGDFEPPLVAGKTKSDVVAFDRDKPIRFSLDNFEQHIDEIQGRKTGKTDSLSASDRKSHDSILDKLNVLRSDPRLKFLMEAGPPEVTLESVILQLTGEGANGSTVKVIDISGLPNEVAGPMAALVCRLLFNYKIWETREEREKDPILIVCEEAHRYVPNFGEAQYREAQDAVRRVAKEGRKYGLGLMLVSQRPADVESTVLSQCNSWIVLRLTNSSDQEHVSRFLPDSLVGLTKILSSLSRREAIFVGEGAALPSRIRITMLPKEKLPDSSDIKFAQGWSRAPMNSDEVKAVAGRWVSGTG